MRRLLALFFFAASAAHAQDVELRYGGPEDARAFLGPTIEELLAPIAVVRDEGRVDAIDPRTVVYAPEDPAPALARVWIERGRDRVTIFLADATWERILVRHVPAIELDEAAREQVAQIVRAAVEALLEGARIGMTREEAREALDLPPPPPPPEDPSLPPPPAGLRATGDVALGYLGQLFADETFRHAVALALALRLGDGSVRPVIGAGADFWPTSSSYGAGLRLDLRTWTLRAEGGVDIEPIEGTIVRACAGIALDITSVEPRAIDGSATRIANAYDALGPLLFVRAAIVQRIWDWIGVSGGVVIDLDPIDTRYVVRTRDGDATVLDPWIVRLSFWASAAVLFH